MSDLYYGMPPGILLKRTLLTSASVTSKPFTTTPLTNYLRLLILGGGGGGGGVPATTTNVAVAGGGASGSWVEAVLGCNPNQTFSYAVGLAGLAGTAGAGGGNGGTSSFPFSGIQAFGGQGGDPGVAGTLIVRGGGSLGTFYNPVGLFPLAIIVPTTGNPGGYGIGMSAGTVAARGGRGADSPWGQGTWDVIANNGQTGGGVTQGFGQYGSGGCGAANSGTQSAQGGSDGAQGLIIVEEYS